MTSQPTPATQPDDPARPRRVSRTLLTLALAGGLVAGGATLASAAASTPTSTGSTPSSTSTATSTAPSPGSTDTPPPAPPTGSPHSRQSPPTGRTPPAGQHGPRAPRGNPTNDADGRITAVSSDSLTVTDEFGQDRTYTITSDTTVHQGAEQQLTADQLTVGEHIHVRSADSTTGSPGTGSSGSNGALHAADIDVHPAHIDGVVTAFDGSTITVVDRDGFTRTITTTSSTSYRQQGSPGSTSSADSIKTGSVVHATGTVDSNGTTLDATSIELRVAGAPGPGAPGPGGPAGGPSGGPAGGPAGKDGQRPPAPAGQAQSPAGSPAPAPSDVPSDTGPSQTGPSQTGPSAAPSDPTPPVSGS